MSQPNEQYAYFTVTGSFDPEDITRRVGIEPSAAWRKGDLHPRTRMERRFSRWSLESKVPRNEPLEAHIASVLEQLEVNAEAFSTVAKQYAGCMQLVGYFHERYPGLNFDASLIARISRFGLSIDFDFYELRSEALRA
jgi:hypothetical protein